MGLQMTQQQANETKKQKNTLLQYLALGAFVILAFADLIVKDADVPNYIFWMLGFGWVGANPEGFIEFFTGRRPAGKEPNEK